MTGLDPIDRELLYFICSCAHHRVRVVRIKARRGASLQRLRYAGLVSFEGFQPSQSALADWLERNQTPAGGPIPELAEPPAPKAVAKGDGDAQSAGAPSPIHRLEEQRSAKPKKNTQGTSGTARKASGAAESTAAKRISDRAPTEGPPVLVPPAAARPVDIKVNTRRDPTQPPPTPYSPEKQDYLRGNAAMRRTNRAKAEAFLDSGKTSQDAGSVSLRIEARKVEVQRAEEARLADPLEQAKTLIRRKTRHVVFGAEVSMGDKGKGKFFIGNKLVSKAELLAMAARLAA